MVKAYCLKCRQTIELKNPMERVTKNGFDMVCGTCPHDGTKCCTIKGKSTKAHEKKHHPHSFNESKKSTTSHSGDSESLHPAHSNFKKEKI
jgi:hypothetical protein